MLDFGVCAFFAHPFCFSCPAGEKPSQVEKSQAKEAALDASQALEAALLSEESVVALCEPTTSCKKELSETGSTCSFGQQINMTQLGIYLGAVCQASSSRMCRVKHRILGRANAEVEQPQVGRFLAMIQFLGRVFTSIISQDVMKEPHRPKFYTLVTLHQHFKPCPTHCRQRCSCQTGLVSKTRNH